MNDNHGLFTFLYTLSRNLSRKLHCSFLSCAWTKLLKFYVSCIILSREWLAAFLEFQAILISTNSSSTDSKVNHTVNLLNLKCNYVDFCITHSESLVSLQIAFFWSHDSNIKIELTSAYPIVFLGDKIIVAHLFLLWTNILEQVCALHAQTFKSNILKFIQSFFQLKKR